jgi:hypothetical protein
MHCIELLYTSPVATHVLIHMVISDSTVNAQSRMHRIIELHVKSLRIFHDDQQQTRNLVVGNYKL